MNQYKQNRQFLIVIVFLMSFCSVAGQDVNIKRNSAVDSLVSLHKKINRIDSLVPGFRVQIFFESGNFSKKQALETAEKFVVSYPLIKYYLSFNEPYYRIRVGDYRTMIEAKGFLMNIINEYPSAFVVEEMIHHPSLIN